MTGFAEFSDENEQRRAAAGASLQFGLDTNPEQAAQHVQLARRYRLPLDLVESDPAEFKRRAQLEDGRALVEQSPKLQNWLAFSDNHAKIAHDDLANLSEIERAAKQYGELKPSRGPNASLSTIAAGLFRALPQGLEATRQGIRQQFADAFGLDTMADDARRKVAANQTDVILHDPNFESSTGRGLYSGGVSLLRQAPGLAASILTRSTAPVLATAGLQTEAEAYSKYRARGATPGEAFVGATGEGAVEVGTELIPMGFLVNKLGKAGAGEFIKGYLGRELWTEQLATFAQDAIDTAVANPDKTWGEFLAERPDAAYQTALATLVQSGAMGAVHYVASRATQRENDAKQAGATAEILAGLNALAEANKVRGRDAETAQGYFQSLFNEGRDSVWITPDALAQSGLADQMAQSIPAVAEQLQAAARMGHDIRIPIADLMATMAGPQLEQSIIPHVSDEPGGFTLTTAQAYLQSGAAQELQAEVERILAEKQGDDTFKASAEAVRAEVKTQLDAAARFTPQVNDAYSTMVGNFYAVTAAKIDTTPEELFKRYPLKVGAEEIGGEQFNQGGALRVVDVFGNGSRVDHYDDKKGLMYSGQRFPTGTRWTVFETFPAEEGGDQVLGDMFKYKSLEEAQAAVRGLRISATQKAKSAAKYGAIPNLWKGEEKKVAKALIDAGVGIERFASSTQSRSKYLYLDSGLKVRIADHALPGTYDQPDVDYRYGGDIKALVEEVKKAEESAPTPDSRELGSPTLSNQDAGAADLRADESGQSEEPAQSGSGAGSDANITGSYGQSNGARGSFNPANLSITLLKNADLSTFLHESGHFFLEVQADIASKLQQEADIFGRDTLKPGERQILNDTDALLRWFGVESLAEWYNLDFEEKRAYHEKFARGFEAYLYEGKAPSIELQGLFQRFRAWLVSVYRELKNLNVELTDEVRGVFDRMLATNEQITLAEQGRSMLPLFATPEQAGMTPEEFAAYQALGVDATNDAIQDLQARGLRDMTWLHNARGRIIKQLQKEAKAQRAEVQIEVRREVMSQSIYRAWQFLTGKAGEKTEAQMEHDKAHADWKAERADFEQKTRNDLKAKILEANPDAKGIERGQLLAKNKRQIDIDTQQAMLEWDKANTKPEAPAAPAAGETAGGFEFGRLDLGELKVMGLPAEVVNAVKARRMTAATGLHPDTVAEMFGFTSGDELVRKLAGAETPKAEIDALTDVRMLEQFGDLSSPEAIEKAADKAIHNDARARFVATEANALAKATGQRKVLASAAKEFARAMIARLKVRGIKPGQYASAEVRAAKAAEKASKAGDLATAAAEKRNQLIQNYATRAAYDAQEEVDKGLRYLKKFEGDIKTLDADYADQIGNLLERFDLRKGQSNKAIDKRTALAEWIKAQREAGLEPDIPPGLENEAFRTSYKNLTVEEFRGLVDTVRQIEHLGRLKHKLLTAADQRAYEAVRDEIAASIHQHAQGREADTRTPTTNMGRAVQGLKRFWASHIKAATWVRVMDGGKDGGPMWEYFVRNANERGDMETSLRAEATAKLSEILAPVFKLGKMGGKGLFFPSINRSLNREARLAIALNIGNDGNLQRLLGGEGWTMAQLTPVLQSLTAQEWQAVQAVWDHFEGYRPQIAAKERRVYGKEPEWVSSRPFAVTTADGTTVQMRGGYYPIKYDPAASQRAEEHADAESAKRQLQGAYTTATTRRSFTKTRVEEVQGRPLLYTLAGLYSGVNDVIHDLAWHEWLIDANRLLRSHTIDAAIRDHYGPEAKQQFKTWVQDVAEGDKGVADAGFASIARLRQGVSAAGLGFNVMSALIQPLGITQSITRVGLPWVGRGVAKYLANPVGLTRTVNGMSSFMENRARTRFRELNELRNQVQNIGGGIGKVDDFVGRYAYFLMMRCQQMVDVPTWWGAYEKAIAEGNEETRAIALADQAVIDAQGGGQVKDQSAMERSPYIKIFTVFYSFMNTALNVGVEKTMSADTPAKRAKLAVDYAMLYVVPAVLGYFIKNAFTPGDSGDDDPEKIAKKLLANQIDYLMGLMVVVREFGEAAKIVTGANDMGRDYTGPAGLRLIADTVNLAKQAHQGEFDTAFRKASINVVGDLFGLPSAQINRTITGAKALAEGKTDNPAAVAFGFQEKR